ncbi:hypothetical protein [Mucilaginibacter sp. BT774]|uniref:hypothetical protein n=1 Tax=Mucilaginibacter sp. BT774 TaxID=3062276 RepID=UPI002675336C|nr:hypothetical protein [Mucilaginibacter sp. BT774]MDO3627276.1 hypothetical protein [Mucilaginibacter sp. BT774]
MIKKKIVSDNLFESGPIVRVKIKSTFKNQKIDTVNNIPERFIMLDAFVDTGASTSVIDISIMNENIVVEETDFVANMNFINANKRQLPVYKVGIDLLNSDLCRDTLIAVMDMSVYSSNIKMLIGRDILRKCIFIYNGIDNTFTLEQKL